MSHVVHAVQHEVEHRINHDDSPGKGHGHKPAENHNKKIALLIAVIALFLAFSETLGKSAQTAGIELNIKASDTWNFFQAKTIRQTTLRAAAEGMAAELTARPDDRIQGGDEQADRGRGMRRSSATNRTRRRVTGVSSYVQGPNNMSAIGT